MKHLQILTPIVASLFILGCSNPADDVPAAKVSSATNAPADAAAPAASAATSSRHFTFDQASSHVDFVGSKVTGSHNGSFKKFEGELMVLDGHLADAGNKVIIDTTSLSTDTDRLTGHLKSPDFFDTTKFPTATFTTASIKQEATNSTVTGTLTLHGITKQISFPAQIHISADAVELKAEFFLNRFDFDMHYPGKADDLIRKEVVLKLNVKAAPATKAAAVPGA